MSLEAAVARAVGRPVRALKRVAGGDINDAYTAELEGGGRAFVKTRPDAPVGRVRERGRRPWTGSLSLPRSGVPEVLGVLDGPDEPRLLVLEWLDAGPAGDEAQLGRGLATVHAAGADAFGGASPLRIGALVLPNDPLPEWPAFYAERRLRPLLAPARDRGALTQRGRARGRAACASGSPPSPARPSRRRACTATCGAATCCGAAGRPFLIDPVAYGGHREVDLAMLRLFGAPGPRMLAAYEEVAPLADGHRGPRRAVAAVPAARPRGAVRRRLRRVGRAGRAAIRRLESRRMDLGIAGRVAVVTGGSRGIGAATADLLEGEGARVVRVSRGDGIDVTAPDAAERIAERAPAPVDILVNNAGTSFARGLDELTDADWYGLWELHVMASMRLMRAFAPGMAERGWGRIVNVSSSAGQAPVADQRGVLGHEGGAALPLARVRRHLRRPRRARQRGRPGPGQLAAVGRRRRPRRSDGRRARARRREEAIDAQAPRSRSAASPSRPRSPP